MRGLLADARAGRYALCYCESWNIESLQAVVEGAEAMGSPIIAGFNGGFLRHPSRTRPERVAYYGALSAALAASAVPTAFILNETDDLAQIEQGLEQGFNAVMVESDLLTPEEYIDLVKKVVRMAHARSASVEAQVGRLPHGCGAGRGGGETTDPGVARAFVERTGVDALGVSIGNVHILTRGKASIDVESLARIRDQVDVPLVVHGGTGFPAEYAAQVIGLGVAKFNFGTNLKQAYLAALREKLAHYAEPMDPHLFLGMGGREDILVAARMAVQQRVQELIETYGFAGARLRPGASPRELGPPN
jgi:ketose-bisphosphate aldolase